LTTAPQGVKSVPLNRYVLFLLLAAGGCALDLLTKHWIFARLGMPHHQPTEWLWEGVFGLTTSLNEGALFGIGQGKTVLFAALSVVAAVGIVWWLFVAGAAADKLLCVALALVTAGIAGNLYDRLGLPGLKWDNWHPLHQAGEPVYAVRDWLNFQLINWPIFNLADSFLVCGAGLLMWHAFRAETRKMAPAAPVDAFSSAGPSSAA
jgi:signal peptidase II